MLGGIDYGYSQFDSGTGQVDASLKQGRSSLGKVLTPLKLQELVGGKWIIYGMVDNSCYRETLSQVKPWCSIG